MATAIQSDPLREDVEREQRVSPLELFVDLVFVFGFTQVTTMLSNDPSWAGLGHALLLLVALWWAWAAYAWLTDAVNPAEGLVWGTIVVAMAAMFVAALAVPEAFSRRGVVFGIAFFVVAVMHVVLYAVASRGDRDRVQAIVRSAPSLLGGAALILAAGFAHGELKPLLWVVALGIGLFGPLFVDISGLNVQPAHFVERHGPIVIIAIGESLIAIGLGARTAGLTVSVVAAAVLGFFVAASFWLAYFDFFTIRAQQLLAEQRGSRRFALARDTYTYLHLPMVAGIVLFAFALKTTLAHVGEHLPPVAAVCLCVGPALYLGAFVAIKRRISREFACERALAAVACAALVPVALTVSALVALSLVAAEWLALHIYELVWSRMQTHANSAGKEQARPAGQLRLSTRIAYSSARRSKRAGSRGATGTHVHQAAVPGDNPSGCGTQDAAVAPPR